MSFKSTLAQIIGKRIKDRRQRSDLNQSQLAEKINLTRTSISNIEAGRHLPPLDVLYDICNVLGSEIHFFLPTYQEINSSIKDESVTLEHLKTNNLSQGSIETVKNILLKNRK